MPKLLVCQHVPYEILGTLDPLLRDSGFRIRYVNFGRHSDARPRLDGYQGLIVLGGPMNVDETDRYPHLGVEMDLVREAVDRGLPVLGICLGAQLIARALGADVGRAPEKEIGWYEVRPTPEGRGDPLVGHFGEREHIFQWHGDTFEIPDGAEHLVDAPGCPNQAFRVGQNVYGFQFHLEVDESMVARWLRVPAMRREIEELGSDRDPETILRETSERIHELRQLSDRTFGEFVRLFGERPRPRILPSR
jgi:GMP synthase (glutamine-hydrolysing)